MKSHNIPSWLSAILILGAFRRCRKSTASVTGSDISVMNSIDENLRPAISIIIPILNEASSIGRTLDALAKFSEPLEVIVVDGGSDDDTVEIVRQHKVKLMTADRGRGEQMHAGARAAQGAVFWFLHADTVPSPDAVRQIVESLRDPRVVGGNFDVQFDSRRRSARFLRWFYRQLRSVGVCYGDAAIFVHREAYEHVGGFKPFPIFEDLDLVRRLRKYGRMVNVPDYVITSARRFEERSFGLTFARWTFLQVLYWLGVNPQFLSRLYAPIRETNV
jgi:rSAM/selenodomain-associated transferase 2